MTGRTALALAASFGLGAISAGVVALLMALPIQAEFRGAVLAVAGFIAAQVLLTAVGEWRAERAEIRHQAVAMRDRVREANLERVRQTRLWLKRYVHELSAAADGQPVDGLPYDPTEFPHASFHVVGDLAALRAFVKVEALLIDLSKDQERPMTPAMYEAIGNATNAMLDALHLQERRILRGMEPVTLDAATVNAIGKSQGLR